MGGPTTPAVPSSGGEVGQTYCLRWNNHQTNLVQILHALHEVGSYVDCSLVVDDEQFQAHRVVLAAEVGKGMEPSEISTALVQGQDHVTEIVKELEQETIVEAFEMPAEEQPPEGQLINEEKSQADESSAEESSPKEEHYPAKPQPVFEEEPELSPNRKLNLYSPTISTKKSERAFRLKTSASPQPEISPRNERESRSTRSLKSDLTLISDEPSRRISPRMGRSPAESHSPQERSPVDKKAITCELAAEKTSKKLCKNEIDHAEEKIAQIKGDEDLQADKQLNPNETDTEILDVEKPLKKRRSRKTQGTDINIATPEREGSFADNKEDAKLVKETPAAEVDQLIDSKVPQIIDSDEPQPKVEIEVVIEEKLPTSETETKKVKENPIKLKQTRRGADKKIIEMQSIILDSSQASDMATDNYRKKPTNARKSRREKKDVERPESDIPTEHTDSEREKNPSRASSKGMDAPSDKEDRSSGRVSRRDKTILDVATCLKENTSSTKTQPSSEDATHSQNKPQTKDRSSQDSEPAKRRQSSKRRNDISRSEEKKSHDTDIDKKYPHPEKGPKKSRSRNVKLKPETKLEAENPIPSSVEPDAAQKDNIQEKIQDNTNKDTKPKYEDTKPEEAPILKVKTETVEQIISADMDPVDPSPGKIRLRRHPVSTEEPENYVPPVSHSISHEPSPLAEEPESSFSNRKIPTKTYLKNKRHRPETPRADESPEKEPIPPITLDKTLESALNLCETKISLPSKPSKRRKRNSRLLHYELSTDIDSDKVESDFNSETMYAETFTKSLGRTSPERFPPKSESVEPIESDSAAKSLSLSNQQAVSTPSTQSSCRQLRVLIKRTPTTSGARGRGSRKYAFSKRKRFRKILANVAEAPPPDQTFHDPDKPLVKSQPECDSIPESKQKPTEQVPKKGIKQATLEIQGTLNDKQKADGEQRGRKKITDKEIHATKESTEEILKEEKSTETEEEAKSEVPDLRTKEVQRENESLNDEISPAKESSKQEACVAKLAPEEESFSIKETPTDPVAVSLKDVPETTPIPESTETIGVTIEPEPESESEASTSSAVKRSLRKREADSSQPDEAAKGKQLQVRDKPGTAKQDQAKSVRRRNLQEAEERPANKRSKFDSDENEKFISYISNETILSSTEAPLKEKKSDPGKSPLPARKPATGKYRHSETNKQIIISATAGKKAMDKSPEGPSPSSKKPMVQTILNANLNLRKPAETEPSPPPAKKSLSKAEILSRETKFHSSVVLKKKTLQASGKTELTKDDAASTASRKVNISVSVMQSDKSTEDTPHSSMASPTLSKKAQQAAQKLTRKLEVKNKMMAKIKKLGPVNPLPRRAEASNELAKTEDPFADTARKADVAKKIEARKSEGSAPARKALPSGVANKKIEDRKSEGASLIAGMTKNLAKKLETRKSEAASLGLSARKLLFQTDTGKKSESKKFDGGPKAAKPVEIAKKAEAEGIGTASVKAREGVKKAKTKMAIPKAGLHSSDAETSSMSRDSSREDPARSSVIEKTAPSSASRAGFATLSMHMTRAASSTRSLAGTPTPGTDKQVNSSKEPSKGTGTLRQTIRGRPRGGRSRQMPLGGLKRKIDDATEATDSKRPRELPQEEKQQQLEEQQQLDKQQQLEMQQKLEMQKHLEKQQQLEKGPVRETAPVAFPVKITAAGSEPLPDSLVMPKAVPSQKAKVRNLCVKVNRLTVRKYLTGNPEKLLAGSQKLQPNRKPEIASDTDSAAESMPELMLERLHSGFRIPMLLSKALPGPGTPIASPLFADQPSAAAASSLASAPNPHRNAAPTPKVAPPAPTKASQSQTIDAKAIAKTASALAAAENHIHNKTILLNKAQKLGAQGKEQMVTTKTMPLPVPILVMEVKTEPEDAPPAEPAVIDTLPKAAESPAATLEKSIQPIPTPSPQAMASSSEVIRLIAPAVVNAPSSSSTSIPAAAASVGNANSFGHTKMFSFLYPNRYQRSYGEVGLDFCCPNLEGPMRAIDPTRLHAKAEVPVLEMPQCLVITTKFISKADKNIPNKVRAKLDMLNKDKTQDSGSETGSNETASPSAAQPIPALNLAELAAGHPDPLDSLTKHLPKGTTLTKKVLPTGVTAPGTASSSMVAHLPPSLIQLPPLCPSDKQRLELQTRVQVFDLVLQSLSRRAANLTLAERQRTIEEIVRTSTLMAIDVDVGTKLLENYVHYLNRATNTKMSLPSIRLNTVGTPAIGTPAVANITIASVPLYDADKNIIGYQSPNITTQTAVPPLDPAVTSTPNTSSAGAKLGSSKTKSPGGSQKQIFNLKTPLSMVTPAPKPKPSAKKKTMSGGTIISMNSAAQKETEGGRKTTPARTVAQSKTAPRVTPKLGAGPIPAVNASTPSSSPKTNVFIINQLAQPEECILPDSNNAVPPMEAEIKGELEDSPEVLL
ncbi:hypothetical protein KR009_004490 [Drosophila setifemur]|nr:hypothetical protein KR009_004490 [Drosophila setifemur]